MLETIFRKDLFKWGIFFPSQMVLNRSFIPHVTKDDLSKSKEKVITISQYTCLILMWITFSSPSLKLIKVGRIIKQQLFSIILQKGHNQILIGLSFSENIFH